MQAKLNSTSPEKEEKVFVLFYTLQINNYTLTYFHQIKYPRKRLKK